MRRFAFGAITGAVSGTSKWLGHTVRAASSSPSSDDPAAGGLPLALPIDILPNEGARKFDYDLLVIGGGSGGIAAAKRAAKHGAKVALCDFVAPSPRGTAWGLGGTCVNVGCIPKKLMHAAATHGENLNHTVGHFGWGTVNENGEMVKSEDGTPEMKVRCDWDTLRTNVEMHIRSLNFGYTVELRNNEVHYMNARAVFVDPHTVECTNKKGEKSTVTARRFLLATGGRPIVPDDVPGAKEHAVTSDDIFRLKRDPGRTLVVGASYVALECAGFLNGIGRPATVMMRSIPLRGFDQDMAGKVVDYMEAHGVGFIKQAKPQSVEKLEDGKLRVTWALTDGTTQFQTFDTVLFATGRKPETDKMGLGKAGVTLNAKGQVIVDRYERTSTPHIYAVGDIIQGGLELTPVAIRAGHLIADRLYKKGTETMHYDTVPTTVFTPLEYGAVGLSEEKARERLGDKLSVFHSYTQPLEWTLPHLEPSACYVKMLVDKSTDKVLGFHMLGPNAGEVTQGVAVAIRAGATKEIFDTTIGIHPTFAEELVGLRITKESGENAQKTGC